MAPLCGSILSSRFPETTQSVPPLLTARAYEVAAEPLGSRSVSSTPPVRRSEEHTSGLQSRGHLVCRLLLEKKKNNRLIWLIYYKKNIVTTHDSSVIEY